MTEVIKGAAGASGEPEWLKVESLDLEAQGVAHNAAGKVVFIEGALPGEEVQVDVHRRKNNWEQGSLAALRRESSQRVTPRCRYFGTCGGCVLQHWQTQSYRAWKRDLVAAALSHEGIEAPLGDLIDAHGEGRRRIVLHARQTREGVGVGFMALRSHTLVEIEDCPVLVLSLIHI